MCWTFRACGLRSEEPSSFVPVRRELNAELKKQQLLKVSLENPTVRSQVSSNQGKSSERCWPDREWAFSFRNIRLPLKGESLKWTLERKSEHWTMEMEGAWGLSISKTIWGSKWEQSSNHMSLLFMGGLGKNGQEVLTVGHSKLIRQLTAGMIWGHWCTDCQWTSGKLTPHPVRRETLAVRILAQHVLCLKCGLASCLSWLSGFYHTETEEKNKLGIWITFKWLWKVLWQHGPVSRIIFNCRHLVPVGNKT